MNQFLTMLFRRRVVGFTLVEMVVTILLLGILGAGLAAFLIRPVEGYRDLARRTALVDAAESALRRMARDVRIALPKSVRVTNLGGGGFALETLPTLDGGKYIGTTAGGNACVRLRTNAADADYDIVGGFRYITPGAYTNYRMVLGNLGTAGNDAYEGSTSVITPLGITVTITRPASAAPCAGNVNNDHVNLSAGHNYGRTTSPTNRRMYIVTTPVTYLCIPNATNPAAGTLTRYINYPINSTQPTDASVPPLATLASSARIVDRVSACNITSSSALVRSRAVITLTLNLEEEGEQVRLVHQVALDNSH